MESVNSCAIGRGKIRSKFWNFFEQAEVKLATLTATFWTIR